MIEDLIGKGCLSKDADYVIIGAGTVGLPTSVLLAEKTGAKVLCLETGGLAQSEDTHPLNEVVCRGTYKGASNGRFRCLGGTSTRWGGALLPFQDADLIHAQWPVSLQELLPYVREVEELFSLEDGAYSDTDFPFDLGEFHVNRLAKWPQFKKRNVAALLDRQAGNLSNLQIWLNAHVTEVTVTEDGVRLAAVSANADKIDVVCKHLIVAAGAIETTRLALLIRRPNGDPVSDENAVLGRYFTDHISTEVAEVVPSHPGALNKIIGFRFGDKGSMRNIRFELSPETTMRQKLPPSFTHIGFKTTEWGGFDFLRELFQHLQRRRFPPVRVALGLVANTPWLLRALWWRFVNKRLLFPAKAQLNVHVVVEQIPSEDNCIRLSKERTDRFGIPLAEIVWSVSDDDMRNVLDTAELFRQTWQSTRFSKLGEWKALEPRVISASVGSSEGIFHPTGSTRMGSTSAAGAVDKDLKLFGAPNVQLLATSVLPTGGGANPTMMLLLLAMRCIDQHCRLRKGTGS